jgi:hypothetical protein
VRWSCRADIDTRQRLDQRAVAEGRDDRAAVGRNDTHGAAAALEPQRMRTIRVSPSNAVSVPSLMLPSSLAVATATMTNATVAEVQKMGELWSQGAPPRRRRPLARTPSGEPALDRNSAGSTTSESPQKTSGSHAPPYRDALSQAAKPDGGFPGAAGSEGQTVATDT